MVHRQLNFGTNLECIYEFIIGNSHTLSNWNAEQKFSTEDSSVDMKIFSEDPRWDFSWRGFLARWEKSHRGSRAGKIIFESPRSSCGGEFPRKYHRGTTLWSRGHRITARNNSLTAGRIFKSTEVLGGKFASEAPLFFHRAGTQRLIWTGCRILE